jgi:hypothetical protein
MAYISQEHKKELAPAIKAVFKKYGIKATLGVRHHSTLIANIKSGPIDFALGDRGYKQVNEFCIGANFEGKAQDFLLELKAAMMIGNHDNSEPMTDYFDVGWYIEINIGQYEKPYLYAPKTKLLATAPTIFEIKEAIKHFYCGEAKSLIALSDTNFSVHSSVTDERLSGVIVRLVKGSYRFESLPF